MAEIDIFHYKKGSSFLYFLHPGGKLFFFIVLSFLTFRSSYIPLLVILVFSLFVFLTAYRQSSNLAIIKFVKSISFFAVFLLFIILVRWITEGGREGLCAGFLYSLKLFILFVFSHILVLTTELSGFYSAVYQILRPLPFISAGRAALILSLTISFIPLVFDQYAECRDAFDSRLGRRSKNLFRKIFLTVFSLIQNTILRADELALAMESRCYNDNPVLPEIKTGKSDIISIFIMTFFTAVIIYLNILFQ